MEATRRSKKQTKARSTAQNTQAAEASAGLCPHLKEVLHCRTVSAAPLLQVRNGLIRILDYKPKAAKQRPLHQLTAYALVLASRTRLPLKRLRLVRRQALLRVLPPAGGLQAKALKSVTEALMVTGFDTPMGVRGVRAHRPGAQRRKHSP